MYTHMASDGPEDFTSRDQTTDEETGLNSERTAFAKGKGWSKRTIYSDMVPKEIKTSKTVAAMFLGEHSTAESMMFKIGVKNRGYTDILWSLWFIGAIFGLLVVGEAIPAHFVWVSLLMLPLPVITMFLLSVDLLSEIVVSLDLYVIYILQFALFVDGMMYCRADLRRVFWYCYLPTMVVSGLVDAYPAFKRAFFAKLFFGAALAILIIWNCFMAFKWEVFGHVFKMSNLSFMLHHISDTLTLLVFYARHLWCSIYRPNYYVMIKAEVLTGRTKAGDRGVKTGDAGEVGPDRVKIVA